ncbi:hypothetical protein HMPREF1246_1791 [Acidaminococcus sp. BV3L6]|nr:hypothetical protein HMPREF1246_1791 [Acidaminococcus sp. BV3L6]
MNSYAFSIVPHSVWEENRSEQVFLTSRQKRAVKILTALFP